jgi:hypothetical protein
MKTKIFKSGLTLPLLTFLAAVTFFSCHKELKVPPYTEQPTRVEIQGTMTAAEGLGTYSATSTNAVMTDSGLYIAGIDPKGLKIEFKLKKTTTGSYELNGLLASAVVTPSDSEAYYTGIGISSGQIRITRIDTLKEIIKGTFSFSATRVSDGKTKSFTSGQFEMNYTPPVVIDTTSSDTTGGTGGGAGTVTGSFAVKIDGTPFNPSSLVKGGSGFGIMTFAAYKGTSENFLLTFNTDVAAGNYALDAPGSTNTIVYSSSAQTFSPDSGKLVITMHDTVANKLKGTFAFRGKNGSNIKRFTEGTFDLTYTP